MTPRENFRLLVDGRTPARVPFTLDVGAAAGFTDTIHARFVRETGARDPAEHFDYDLRTVSLERRRGDARGYPVAGYAGSIYEWSWWLRGMEQFLVDLLERPDLAEALVAKVAGFTTRLALASARAGIDLLCFYDDAGSQAGMQISPPFWRSLIKPAWKSVLGTVRREHPEARFFLHSCGDITPVVADVAEIGFHVLHPVQPGMHGRRRDQAAARRPHRALCHDGRPAHPRARRGGTRPDGAGRAVPRPTLPHRNSVPFSNDQERDGKRRELSTRAYCGPGRVVVISVHKNPRCGRLYFIDVARRKIHDGTCPHSLRGSGGRRARRAGPRVLRDTGFSR